MIEFKNVTCHKMEFGKKQCILRDASFIIPDGTSVAIFSRIPKDNQKILRLILGTIPVDSGTIKTDSKISWPVGEIVGLQAMLSGRQSIKLVCGINGIGAGKSNRIAEMIAEYCEFPPDQLDLPMTHFRPEARARLFFALSIALRFDYYLVSRQMWAGSGAFRRKSQQSFLEAIRKSAVIVASQNPAAAQKLCTAAVVMDEGRVTYYDAIDEAVEYIRGPDGWMGEASKSYGELRRPKKKARRGNPAEQVDGAEKKAAGGKKRPQASKKPAKKKISRVKKSVGKLKRSPVIKRAASNVAEAANHANTGTDARKAARKLRRMARRNTENTKN